MGKDLEIRDFSEDFKGKPKMKKLDGMLGVFFRPGFPKLNFIDKK